MQTDYRKILADSQAADALLSGGQAGPDQIRRFRSLKLSTVRAACLLLEEGADPAADGQLIPFLRQALTACCQAAQTMISDVSPQGCRITEPDAAPDALRQECLRSYDLISRAICACDPMFIPPFIERSAPDAAFLIELQRRYDGARRQKEQEKEISNRSLNRLFGGKG